MKNRKTDEPLMVIVFMLVPKEHVEKDGTAVDEKSEEKAETAVSQGGDDDVD